MKKPKRPFELEANELDSSKDAGNGLELEDGLKLEEDDEEIIDLEDILTDLPDEGLEEGIDVEEDLDFAELLDAESGVKMDVTDMEQESSYEDILDEDVLTEDLFKDFSFGGKPRGKSPDSMAGEESAVTDREVEDRMDFDEDIFAGFKEDPVKPLVEESVEESKGEIVELFPQREAEEEPLPALEGLVSQIESHLLQAVREMVEARLPDIVRTVLQEEIEKMKKESGK